MFISRLTSFVLFQKYLNFNDISVKCTRVARPLEILSRIYEENNDIRKDINKSIEKYSTGIFCFSGSGSGIRVQVLEVANYF